MVLGSRHQTEERPDQQTQQSRPLDGSTPGATTPMPPANQPTAALPGESAPQDVASLPQPELDIITYDGVSQQSTDCALRPPITTIGSDPANDIVIDSPVIAPFFAEVTFEDEQHPRIIVRDTASDLFYKGSLVKEHTLSSGDVLRVGDPNGSVVTLIYSDGGVVTLGEQQTAGTSITLGNVETVTIGRATANRVVLNHPLVSERHARLTRNTNGDYTLTDLGSTNGTFVNGFPIRSTRLVPGAEVRIGPYRFVFTGSELMQYDETKSIRIDAIDLEEYVHVGPLIGGHRKILLNNISLSILPGSFVAVVGASGSGKTTLLNALNGQRAAQHGTVLYNEQDFYHHTAAFSSQLGFVPQDDIIHKNLTVERALYYAARLRLPKDFTRKQIKERVTKVLDDVEMLPQRHQLISALSGGQRKRVSIGVELLADPPVFFLDEPNSGLDPGLDRKLMQLLRRLADRGHTIMLSTHATANINVCDYVCFLAPGGKLVYYGPPDELKRFFHKNDYAEIYNEIYADPDRWMAMFKQSPEYLQYVAGPRLQSEARAQSPAKTRSNRLPQPRRKNPVRQFLLLTERYCELVARDRTNLLILLVQAPIIALLTLILATKGIFEHIATPQPNVFPQDMNAQATLFIMVCSAIWFGTINSAREIVKEAPVYRRERAVSLRIGPYILSKIAVLGVLCALQSFLLLIIVGTKTGYPPNGILFPGKSGALGEMYITLLLTSLVGLAMGLLISTLAPNTDRAVSIVPIILIPQIIFANVIFTISGTAGKIISYIMPARWGMQAIGSIVRLHDKYTDHGNTPFYRADRIHEIGFWLALIGLALVFLLLALWFQSRKDILHDEKEAH